MLIVVEKYAFEIFNKNIFNPSESSFLMFIRVSTTFHIQIQISTDT